MKRLLALFLVIVLFIASSPTGILTVGLADNAETNAESSEPQVIQGEEDDPPDIVTEEEDNPSVADLTEDGDPSDTDEDEDGGPPGETPGGEEDGPGWDIFLPELRGPAMSGPAMGGPESGEMFAPAPELPAGSMSVTFDQQPQNLAEVQAAIAAYESLPWYEAVKPRWEWEVPAMLMPNGYRCELVDWDDSFGAAYYTFFMNVTPLSALTFTGSTRQQLQDYIDNTAQPGDTVYIRNSIDFDIIPIKIRKNITLASEDSSSPVALVQTRWSGGAPGRHFHVFSGGRLTLENIILEGGSSAGGIQVGVLFDGPGSLVLKAGAVIQNCVASGAGGGVMVACEGSGFSMETGAVIKNCVAQSAYSLVGRGGGVAALVSCSFSVTGGSVINNTADSGGGIYATADASLDIAGAVLSANRAYSCGGAVYAAGSSAVSMTGMTVGGAAGANQASYGGAVYAADEASVNITGGTVGGNLASIEGGGVYCGGAVTIDGSVISGNKAPKGGGIMLKSDIDAVSPTMATLLVTGGSEVKNNEATGSEGGGIYIFEGEATIVNSYVENNTAPLYGGGIYIFFNNEHIAAKSSGSVALNVSGGRISGNTAGIGGGIFDGGNNNVEIQGARISGNTALGALGSGPMGGGVYSIGFSSVAISGGAVIEENHATDGAGVYCGKHTVLGKGTRASDLTVTASAIKNHTVTGNGGGIYAYGAVTLNGAAVSGNTAYNGGGVYIARKTGSSDPSADVCGSLAVTGGSISGNTSQNFGGGVFSAGKVILNGCAVENNRAYDGGGVYLDYNASFVDSAGAAANSNLYVTGGGFSGNQASHAGGGIMAAGYSAVEIGGGAAVTRNTATDEGGGIYSVGGRLEIFGAGTTVSRNETGNNGGGIFTAASSSGDTTLRLRDGASVDHNTAALNGGGVTAVGVIGAGYVKTVNFYVTNAKITDNEGKGTSGGGIYVHEGKLYVTGGSEITGNKILSGQGGGICALGASEITVSGSKIKNNQASIGGGIYSRSAVTFTGAEIAGNTASSYGGGVSLYSGGGLTATGGEISGNSAAMGGGIYANKDTEIDMTGAAVSGNTGSVGGGGIYAGGLVTLDGTSVTGNKAFSGMGGGISGQDASVITVTGGAVSDNQALMGGGVCFSGKLTLDGAEISGNKATSNGGGIYISSLIYVGNPSLNTHGVLTVIGGGVSGNEASLGGGIYGHDGTELSMIGASVTGNKASANGAGIYTKSGAELVRTAVSGNRASGTGDSFGGGIYAYGRILLTDCSVENNYASYSGGGIYMHNNASLNADASAADQGNLFVSGGKINGNEALKMGGGVYGGGKNAITVSGGAKISANSANSGAGLNVMNGKLDVYGAGTAVSLNIASGNGGGIYGFLGDDCSVTVRDGAVVDSNRGYNGGGISTSVIPGGDSVTVTVDGGAVSNNTALGNIGGGGIYSPGGPVVITGGALITGNKAPNGGGGGVYTSSAGYADLNISASAVFSGNSAAVKYAPPQNALTIWWNYIKTETSSVAEYNHPVNNFDINVFMYTVTFKSDGVTAAVQNVLGGYKAVRPADPVKPGHSLEGWYKDTGFSSKWNFLTDAVLANTTLYASWSDQILSVSVPVKLLWAAFNGDDEIDSPEYRIINYSAFPVRVWGKLTEPGINAGEGLELVAGLPGLNQLRLDILGGNSFSGLSGSSNPFAASFSGLFTGNSYEFGFLGGTENDQVSGVTYGKTGWFKIGGKYGGPELATALRPTYAMEFFFERP